MRGENASPALRMRTLTLTEPALVNWGEQIGKAAQGRGPAAPPLILALRGPLGAGKSVLARAVARGAGVRSPMPSPSFNLLYEYEGDGVTVCHIDLYRLEQPDEVWELGWRELGRAGQIVLIEWPERAAALLPGPRWDVQLDIGSEGATLRTLSVERVGDAPELPHPRP